MRIGARVAERSAAFVWGVAEALLFFVVADVLLSWIALRLGLKRATIAALCAALGAVMGGEALYAWSVAAPAAARSAVEALPAIHPGAVALAAQEMRSRPWWAPVLAASFTGEPYKVYAAAAPHAGVGALALGLATPFIRLPRYLLNCLAFAWLGPWARRRFSRRTTTLIFAAGWAAVYLSYWTLKGW